MVLRNIWKIDLLRKKNSWTHFCRVVKGSDILKESTIVLDGFTGFTPVQNRLLGELLEVCREVIVTVTMDDREKPVRL